MNAVLQANPIIKLYLKVSKENPKIIATIPSQTHQQRKKKKKQNKLNQNNTS